VSSLRDRTIHQASEARRGLQETLAEKANINRSSLGEIECGSTVLLASSPARST